ncbi:MAG: SpoIIE family protein phosphatase [Blastocatellia bacterium]
MFVAQAQTVFTLTAAQLQNGQAVELDKLGWKYSPDDDPRFAEPQFDDRAWATLADSARPEDSAWRGSGWFRLHLRVAPELANVALNLEMAQLGASEVYVNGRLIRRFGVVGKTLAEEAAYNPNALPLGVVLQADAEQVLAVRYSNQRAADLHSFMTWQLLQSGENSNGIADIGFYSRFREFGVAASQRGVGYGVSPLPFGYIAVEATVFLSFSILHLLIFAFFVRQRGNLFYGLFLLGFAIYDYFSILFFSGHYGLAGHYLLLFIMGIATNLTPLALLAFLYNAFTPGRARRMWFFLAAALFVIFWCQVWPVRHWLLVGTLYSAACALEMLSIVVGAMWRRLPGAGIVGTGVALFSLTLVQMYLVTPIPLVYALGSFGMILALSLYLAREYASTNKSLEAQLIQVKQLSAAALEHEKVKAENARRAAELEEARQLQLSMLPKKLPQLPHLDIAAYMKTASEVGGDYYDFHLGEDGTLTIAVGDATGHGLKAGTLVSSVKSLFVSLAYHPDIPHILHRISTVLKAMKLRGLFMAMTMVKVQGQRMTVSIAGMPSVLIYRALTDEVEEIAMRALPLGGVTKYQYQQQEVALAENDVVVLLSDGLPERFNPHGAMLEDERIHQALPALGGQSAEEIIAGLVRLGDEWSAGHPQADDITFVVLKFRRS